MTPPLTLASGQSSPTPTFSHDDAVVNQIVGAFFTLMHSMLHTKRIFLCCNLELGIRICAWFHSALQARITAKLCLGLLLDAKGMTYKSSVKCLAVYGRHCMFILFQVDMPFPSEDHAVLWSVRYSALYSQSHFFFLDPFLPLTSLCFFFFSVSKLQDITG